ncbi:MAG: hypothetical protein ACYDHN_01200 [Solirubrobacteraceae bacterium]
MSESAASQPDRDGESTGSSAEQEEEVLDGVVLAGPPRILPVHASEAPLTLERRGSGNVLPAVQAAAVAAGGFVAGAAVVGLVHRRQRRSGTLTKGRRGRAVSRGKGAGKDGRAGELLQIVGSRSLLVDVHLLGGGADR